MKRITVAIFLLVALLFPRALLAGTAQFRDEAQILPAASRDRIAAGARAWPFDLKVLATAATADRSAFERRVSAAVTSPDVVVVGIDPVHRYTVVRVGLGLRLEPGTFNQIVTAGNDGFRGARWVDGILAIGDTAKRKVEYARYIQGTQRAARLPETRPVVMAVQPAPDVAVSPAHDSSAATIGWVLLGFVVTLIVFCVVGALIARRRERRAEKEAADRLIERETERILAADRKREDARVAELTAVPVEPMPSRYVGGGGGGSSRHGGTTAGQAGQSLSYERPAYREPSIPVSRYAPAPVQVQPVVQATPVVVHHHDNGAADGLLTGMLLGEAMHSHHHHDHSDRHVVERVVEREPERSSYDGGGASSSWASSPKPESYSPPAETSSYDGGGSSSSWDSGSSSSSSSDSSYDSGSSSSFDGGGGSSDF